MSTQPLVLVADDEPRITKLVSIALSEEGFRVVTADSGEEALRKAEEVRPDIVLLDIVMPDLDGIEVMRQLRERRPVAGDPADRQGLDRRQGQGPRPRRRRLHRQAVPPRRAGRARPRGHPALVRRARRAPGIVAFDDVEIDLERRMVTRDGELVQLSRTEWLLLQHLAANAGKVVLHTELLTKVWGPEYRDDLQYLRVWVSPRPPQARRRAGRARPDQDVPGHRLPARRRAAGRRPRRSCRRRRRRRAGSALIGRRASRAGRSRRRPAIVAAVRSTRAALSTRRRP